jgi:RNA polymerase sigma factor CnrH
VFEGGRDEVYNDKKPTFKTRRGLELSDTGAELGCLVERCNRGDEEAWQEFYARYHRMVSIAVRRLCPVNFSEAEDIVQEVFYNLFVALKSYDPARPIEPYVLAIAKRVAISYLRKNSPGRPKASGYAGGPVGPLRCPDPEELMIKTEEQVLLRRALDTLPADARRLLALRFNDELPYGEIAARLKVKEVTLRTQVSRYLSSLGRNYTRLRATPRRTDDE